MAARILELPLAHVQHKIQAYGIRRARMAPSEGELIRGGSRHGADARSHQFDKPPVLE